MPLDDTGGDDAGAVYALAGPISWGSTSLGDTAVSTIGSDGSRLGWSMTTLDLDASGEEEIIISAPGADRVFGFYRGGFLE